MDGGIKRVGNQKLTERAIQAFLARHTAGKEKPHAKLSDGDGMYLTVTRAGTPVWRMKYHYAGVERSYSIGPYPEIGLSAAREARQRARAHLREGREPSQTRELERAAAVASSGNTFETVARAWFALMEKGWSEVHYEKSWRAIERDILPKLGELPIANIRPSMVTNAIREILARGVIDTAAKIREHVEAIFEFAQAEGLYTGDNPARPARKILPRRIQQKRRPALLTFAELGEVLRNAELARLSPAVRVAHRLCAFAGACARISNVVEAKWAEFDLDAEVPVWSIPRPQMKKKNDRTHDHKVYLGPTIAAELRAWRRLSTGKGYVFSSDEAKDAHITRESIEKAYRETLGLRDRHTPHGWRSSLTTLAREQGHFEKDVVELALDHVHDNEVVRAYDRGERLEQRIRLMRWWDGELARAQEGAEVLTLKRAAA